MMVSRGLVRRIDPRAGGETEGCFRERSECSSQRMACILGVPKNMGGERDRWALRTNRRTNGF